MSTKADKLATRLEERISAGQFYEAQQQARVVASRHAKVGRFTDAADLLASVAQSLLRAGQGGSAGDLCVMLVDVYRQAGLRPDASSRGRLLACLRLFEPAEPTRRRFINDMVEWSAKFGDSPSGDAEIHHVIGTLYADEREPYDAERHLLVGTRDSAEVLARLEFAWYCEDEPSSAAYYVARAVLPSLLLGNMRAATTAYRVFTTAMISHDPSLGVHEVSSASCDVRVFPTHPLLNFLALLLLAAQRGSPELFRRLTTKFSSSLLAAPSWKGGLELIAEIYFGILRPRQSNPLMDMMGSFFGGGPTSKAPGPRRIGHGRSETLAPEGLD